MSRFIDWDELGETPRDKHSDYVLPHELRKYGSDLNKWIAENCSRKQTVLNIDLLQFKRGDNRYRVTESKHKYERLPDSQLLALNLLATGFDLINSQPRLVYRYDVFVIRGDLPYDDVMIERLTAEPKSVRVQDVDLFRAWMSFEVPDSAIGL